MPHAISSRDGSSSPPTQNVPPRSPRRGRGAGADLAPDRRTMEFEALGLAVKAVDPSWSWE